MARARRHDHPLGVLFVDLDGFKAVNDRHGHPAGDEVLRETARRMRSAVRGEDTVARWNPSSGPGFAGAEDLLQAADSAMYRVKQEAKASVHVYSPDDVRPEGRLRRRERLEAALERDELVVYYQPVVDLRAGRVAGAEALVRWQHPERGLVAPDSFVSLAEETGLVRRLDEHVLSMAARRASAWIDDPGLSAGPDFRMSVNISPHRYDEEEMPRRVREVIAESELPPEALQLEVAERLALRQTRPFRELREEGVSLAVDDFGTGYSSLLYLRHLDADTLEVDQYFVQEINEEQTSSIILRSVLSIGNHLDVNVVAGGVQTAAQRDHLRDLGFRLAQGFFFGRPMPADDFRRVLRAGTASASA